MKQNITFKIILCVVTLTILSNVNFVYADQGYVKLKSLSSDESLFTATACIDLPSSDPWWPQVSLEINGEEMQEIGITLVDAKNPETMRSKNRCFLFEIPIQIKSGKNGNALFKIKSVLLDRQPDFMNQTYLNSLRERVKKTAPELDFKIETVQTDTGGGLDLIITSKPSTMTDDEAIAIIMQAANLEIPIGWELPVHLH